MKVVEGDYVVLLKADGEKYTLCNWAIDCPKHNNEGISCEECPAAGLNKKVTRAEAVKWWEKAEIKK